MAMEQYHFVIKDSKSASLSQGDQEEAYRIRCHVQTQRRRGAKSPGSLSLPISTPSTPNEKSQGKQSNTDTEAIISRESPEPREVASPAVDLTLSSPRTKFVPSHWSQYYQRAARGEELYHLRTISFPVQPYGNSTDPFNSTSMICHPLAHQLIKFMESDFNSSVFRAEALACPSAANPRPADLRHETALSERIRNALQNDMLMLSTLAYASGAIGWRYGVRHEELPPEYFIQRTYRSIREHLQRSGEVEEKLLWSIYGLAAAEMWVLNFDAAATHMRAIQVLISQLGGITKLTPLILESIILGGKFLALFTMAPPIPSTDFEPDGWPEGWLPQSIFSIALPLELRNLGTSFFAAGALSAMDDWYREILVDLVACVQISHYRSGPPNQSLEPVHERWLYLKVQALNYRLLARTELIGIQEAVRVATLLWVLSITDYVGAGLTALFLLPKLQAALEMAQSKEPSSSRLLPGLYFWMSTLGALVALSAAKQILLSSSGPKDTLYSQQFDFFSLHAAQTARLIGLETKTDVYRSFLQTYLYLDVNGGSGGDDLKYLVEAISRIDQDSLLDFHMAESISR